MRLRAFNGIALLHPQEQVQLAGKERIEEENTELIAGPVVVLAQNDEQARVLVGRKIEEKYVGLMHRIEVVVRPF